MIQRTQSLFLLLTILLSFLFLKGGIVNFSAPADSVIKVTFSGIFRATELLERNLLIPIFIIIVPVFSAVIIFLFKKRGVQLTLVKILMALISVFIFALGYYTYLVITRYNASITPGIKMVIPVIQLFLTYLAYRGIKKDDDLVRSYDRLR